MHHRPRHIEQVLAKRCRLFPTLGLLGARQVGKSTFLMKQWKPKLSASYFTLDRHETIMRIKQAPEQFLLDESDHQNQHLIVDEAQKLPQLFDSIKSIIDAERRMGSFTLSGSTEFSSKSGVRESLAGRMGITRMYPMTLRELSNDSLHTPWLTGFNNQSRSPLAHKVIHTWMQRGGMPIFCNISDRDERITVFQSWIEAICFRDMQQLSGATLNGETAYELLKLYAQRQHYSQRELSSLLGVSTSAIKKHLSALEALFLIYKLPNFATPSAQPAYQIFDAGVLNALLGGHETLLAQKASLQSLIVNEIYAQYEYAGKLKPKLHYYKTRGGASIHLILQTTEQCLAIQLMLRPKLDDYQQRGMKHFLEKHPSAKGYFMAPIQDAYQLAERLWVIPWTFIG